MKKYFFTAAVSVILLFTMTACQKPVSLTSADPDELLTNTLASLESAQSLESVTNSETTLTMGDVSQSSTSEMNVALFQEPLTAQVEISMKSSGSLSGDQEASLDAYMVTEGEDFYAYINEGGNWIKEKISSIDLNYFIENPIQKFGYFVNGKKEVADLGTETLDGKEARVLEIKSDPAIFSEYTREFQSQFGLTQDQVRNCGDFVTKAWITDEGLAKYDIDLSENIKALGDSIINDANATEESKEAGNFIKGLDLKLTTTVSNINAAAAVTLPEEAKMAIEYEYPEPFEQTIETPGDQAKEGDGAETDAVAE